MLFAQLKNQKLLLNNYFLDAGDVEKKEVSIFNSRLLPSRFQGISRHNLVIYVSANCAVRCFILFVCVCIFFIVWHDKRY